MSIYHMIRDDKDFLPVDFEQTVVQRQRPNELNLEKVVAFLGEQGVDDNIIRQVESQCSRQEPAKDKGSKDDTPKKRAQKKQPESNTVAKPRKEEVPTSLPGRKRNLHPLNQRLLQRKIRLL